MESRPNHNAPPTNSAHKDWIVVEDPKGDWFDGALVDATRAQQLAARGVTLLPVLPGYFRSSGVGGFFKRGWGSGHPLSRDNSAMHCPILLYLETQRPGIGSKINQSIVHWRARVVGEKDGRRLGQLRLVADTAQATAQNAHIAQGLAKPVDFAQVGAPDERGGWTVGGEVQLNVPMSGHYGFALYGTGPGLRVTWAAASVTLTSR